MCFRRNEPRGAVLIGYYSGGSAAGYFPDRPLAWLSRGGNMQESSAFPGNRGKPWELKSELLLAQVYGRFVPRMAVVPVSS